MNEERCPIHGTVVTDGWCQVLVGGQPHAVSTKTRTIYVLPDGESIEIHVTPEGLIIDCVDRDGDVIGTFANTFEELFDRIVGTEQNGI